MRAWHAWLSHTRASRVMVDENELRRRKKDKEQQQKPLPSDAPGEGGSNLSGEYGNIALLFVLYTLQGVPMGIRAVFPLALKERGASFADLATFSLSSWPFSLKLLWAPIVDVAYIHSIGRRKTWMVPAQLLIGAAMIGISFRLGDLLYGSKPEVPTLAVLFFCLQFLVATQDIAVDGWALTMLRPENVGYAATCNAVGQTFGYAIGFTGYTVLEQLGVTDLSTFLFVWGVVFLVVTAVVALFKREAPLAKEDEPEGVVTAYRQMFSMFGLQPMWRLLLVLFTWKMAFPILESVAPLKLQDLGVPKEHLAYMTSLLMPMYVLLPLLVSKWTSGPRPLSVALRTYPLKVLLIPSCIALGHFAPMALTGGAAPGGSIPWAFYAAILAVMALGAVASETMFVAQMAFFARVSDPALGGTYMTLLNTMANLGGKWPETATLFLVDYATCLEDSCSFKRDGFYVVAALCTVVGVLWYVPGRSLVRSLELAKPELWKIH